MFYSETIVCLYHPFFQFCHLGSSKKKKKKIYRGINAESRKIVEGESEAGEGGE